MSIFSPTRKLTKKVAELEAERDALLKEAPKNKLLSSVETAQAVLEGIKQNIITGNLTRHDVHRMGESCLCIKIRKDGYMMSVLDGDPSIFIRFN